MPPLNATDQERRDLLAYLSRLGGIPVGQLAHEPPRFLPRRQEQVLHPEPGEWPTYNGNLSANRHSTLDQINAQNVSRLQLQWSYSIPYPGLEMTPLVADGVMYVTGPNQVCALDAQTGRQIWCYSRPRTPAGTIAGDAAKGANRGAAILGDRVFFVTDNAHLICLNRLTGALMWDVFMPETPGRYGSTGAPLVVGDLVISVWRAAMKEFADLSPRTKPRPASLHGGSGLSRNAASRDRRHGAAKPSKWGRLDMAHRILRSRNADCCTGRRAIPFPTPMAKTARATIFTQIASSRSMCKQESCDGISSSRRMIFTIGMRRSRSCW